MSNSPILQQQTDRVSVTVKINGSQLKDDYKVVRVEVEKRINKLPRATVEVLDGSSADQKHENLDNKQINAGDKIVIEAGFAEDTKPLFEGIVTGVGLSGNANKHGRIIVEATDGCHSMTITRKTKYFPEKKDSEIVKEILGDHSNASSGSIETTDVKHKKITQYACTDWDFLLDRASVSSRIIVAENNKLNFVKPGGDSAPIELEYGFDIIDFDIDFDGSKQDKQITVKSWDPSNHKLVTSSSSEPSYLEKQGSMKGNDLAGKLGIQDETVVAPFPMESEELKQYADSRIIMSRLAKMRGHITCQGFAEVTINSFINLKKIHSYYDGEAYIAGVVHSVEDGNYTTEIQLGVDSNNIYEKPSGSSMLDGFGAVPPTKGLFLGQVTKIHGDPDGDFRVQVKVPAFNENDEGLWARLSSQYAGKDYGYVWYPEVDDQVVLAFLMNDPRHPIILGSIYSKKHNVLSDFEPKDGNYKKAIVTKSDLQISFNDEHQNIQIRTPGGHVIDIKDEDETIKITDNRGSYILFDSDGIEMDSVKNIKINARQDITIDAGGKIEYSARSSIKGDAGSSMDLSAMSKFSAKGGSGNLSLDFSNSKLDGTMTTVSSNSVTTIKGSMVMIN